MTAGCLRVSDVPSGSGDATGENAAKLSDAFQLSGGLLFPATVAFYRAEADKGRSSHHLTRHRSSHFASALLTGPTQLGFSECSIALRFDASGSQEG